MDKDVTVLKAVSGFVALSMWIMLAATPAMLGLLLAGPVCLVLGEVNGGVVVSFTVIGMICGAVWAERIRSGEGLSAFWNKLVASPELDRY
ncbi:hypothetical protein [Photobacterium halotolerans]|uniref:Uncharacterized protein n=1 Tax=Photobacterium halotolerans TaxID=265726 RepID=A0A7X4W8B3_9GAMM|nr:hypothetical protein [Photobacterium halotolerans]NAW64044.1 hypothetical protein [Photobacterium halotolerans]NAW85483.1 hypothetical protein [Photobacterium halotolerans]